MTETNRTLVFDLRVEIEHLKLENERLRARLEAWKSLAWQHANTLRVLSAKSAKDAKTESVQFK